MPQCFMLITCCVWKAVRVPGVLAAVGISTLQCQLHNVREWPITNLVGGRYLQQIEIPGLQLL